MCTDGRLARQRLPTTVRGDDCPMRSLRTPGVLAMLTLYTRCLRHQTLPRAGGLDDQDPREMAAFDVIAASLAQAPPAAQPSAADLVDARARRRR